ncbi:hypothetical protein HHK36_029188 [Tetracentron sinense]|uniref:LOB domain-containing protein n=1 Tax=Tetracentron sinense TaxID=13715 RepID=A0A834YIR1_TETSI|nr:hypothetical protein HHK36_029188 [Tetracentron sinense]
MEMDPLQIRGRSRTYQPCAACRMLRRRCGDKCLLAPFFPAEDVENFAGVHKVFGASNVNKMLQVVEETNREDAVKSIVYEASARLRDPIYGSAGVILQLQKHVQELEVQLESTRAQVLELREQRDELSRILMNVHQLLPISPIDDVMFDRDDFFLNDNIIGYDPLNFL